MKKEGARSHPAVTDPQPGEPGEQNQIVDEPPPILRTWLRVYTFVMVYLAAVIFAFYLFTVHFAP